MALSPGTRLGHYDVTVLIGEGGMGQVWQATDTQLGRDVAIKVLPDLVAQEPERLARFEREARVLASLNHTNIATLFGIERDGDTLYLVMELVEGETLAERIARGAIPAAEAVPVFLQIAEGLDAAHEQGVIHRDLKPANIKVAPDGHVKILDFGLAKAMADEGDAGGPTSASMSPTLTVAATQRGEILGTAAYMSPEQARGVAVDKRTDIWAFGCCLFESVTGTRVFPGDSAPDILAAVLRAEPDFLELPADMSPPLEQLLRRCLTKDRRARLRDIGEARFALEGYDQAPGPPGREPSRGPGGPPTWWWLASGVAVLLVGATGWWLASRDAEPPVLRHRSFALAAGEIADYRDPLGGPVISPDGTMVAFVDQERLFVRDLAALEPRELPDTFGAERPFWSPDSAWIGYFTDTRQSAGAVRKVSVRGGSSTYLGKTPFGEARGASWGPDDELLVALSDLIVLTGASADGGLFTLSANGGEMSPFAPPGRDDDDDSIHAFPHHLPDGETLLAVADGDTLIAARDDGTWTLAQHPGEQIAFPVYASGHVVYQRGTLPSRGIWGLRFDPSSPGRTPEPFQVSPVGSRPSLSADGTLVYHTTEGTDREQLAWVDRLGTLLEPIGTVTAGLDAPRLSADGTMLAALVWDDEGNGDIWTFDLQDGAATRVTVDPALDIDPAWSPTGDRLVFSSFREGPSALFLQGALGRAAVERLQTGPLQPFWPRFEPGGEAVIYQAQNPETDWDIWRFAFDSQEVTPLVQGPDQEFWPELSPDGQLVLFSRSTAAELGSLYLAQYPSLNGQTVVSGPGARARAWSPDGDEIFYSDAENRLVGVAVDTTGTVRLGTAEILFDGDTIDVRLASLSSRAQFATPDGERFVVVRTLSKSRVVATLRQDWMPVAEE